MPKNNLLEVKFKGDYKAYCEYMSALGRKGGKAKVSKGKNKK